VGLWKTTRLRARVEHEPRRVASGDNGLMLRAEIRYIAADEELELDDGQRITGDGVESFAASMELVGGLKGAALKKVLAAASKNHWDAEERLWISLDHADHFDPATSAPTLTDFVFSHGDLLIRAHVFFDEEPRRKAVIAATRLHLARRSADASSFNVHQVKDQWQGVLDIRPRLRGQTLEELHALGDEVGALLMTNAADQPLTQHATKRLLDAGLSEALVGQPEGEWLDAKRAPYRLDEEGQEFELAKDVAALANAEGGLIIIGMKTRNKGDGDVIAAVNGCQLSDVPRRRYVGVLERKVFPAVAGVEIVKARGASPNPDIAYIEVPGQSPGAKPFLVRGAVVAGRYKAAFISVPVRRGEGTSYVDIAMMHARLRAGAQALGGSGTQAIQDRVTLLEADRGDFGDIVLAAKRQGFTVNPTQRDISFTSPSGEVVTAPLHGAEVAQPLHRQELLKQLARLGLRTRTTTRGFVIPDDH
jgi:hypothetical protein